MIKSNNLLGLTQQDVIEWYQNREHIFPGIAEELSKIWGDELPQEWDNANNTISIETVQILARTSSLISQDGLIYGINATIAELLFNDRTKTGGSYNQQIQQIKAELERILLSINTTTTDQNTTTAAEAA